jgi:EF-P beta-lysylation protein EpmB
MVTTAPLWRKIQKNNFTKVDFLADYLELSQTNRQRLLSHARFPLNLPKRLASKIEKNQLEDPILRQFIPLDDELKSTPGFVLDPVSDQTFQQTKKILHKYQGRALLVTTSACAMNCRFCFRQNFPYETEEKKFDEDLSYIQNNPNLSEIILSGGDPLSLSQTSLDQLFSSLNQIDHLKRIRFHSRFPIGIPERIDSPFLHLLKSSTKQIYFIIHSNHPKEIDFDVASSLKKIQSLGIPVLNQSVLLKGVNDDEKTLLTLSETLINVGVTPYYLHILDPVQGAAHFAVPEERGAQIIRYIRENLSGYGVPKLVKEVPGMTSKTFINH